MKTNKEYNFRVGDYVETYDKDIGYIASITRQALDDGDIFYHIKVSLEAFQFYRDPTQEMEFDGTINLIRKAFNRIGKYDFTKEEQSKEIEKLPHCSNGWHATVTDKINELVKAVNELRSGKK